MKGGKVMAKKEKSTEKKQKPTAKVGGKKGH